MVTIYYSNTRSQQLAVTDMTRTGAWIHVIDPSLEELAQLADTFKLDADLLADVLDLYESPRIERDGANVYTFTRYCFPEGIDIATEPMLIIYTPNHMLTILRNHNPVLDRLLTPGSEVITTQRTKTFLQVLGAVNFSYERHLHKVSKRILSIRGQLRRTEIRNKDFIDFIDIEEDLNEFTSALQAQSVVLRNLLGGRYMRLYEDDRDLIEDLSLGTAELIELTDSRLKTISNIREAYSTIMANTLNRTFKNLTSISIFLTIPMIATGMYGMNLALPIANDRNAFWYILLVVLAATSLTIYLFKKQRWL